MVEYTGSVTKIEIDDASKKAKVTIGANPALELGRGSDSAFIGMLTLVAAAKAGSFNIKVIDDNDSGEIDRIETV
jgi:hypothetical protein